MLPVLRLRSPALVRRTAARVYSSTMDRSHANDPKPQAPVQNVSATNATPTSSEGTSDRVLVEKVEDAEEMRVAQAPNRAGVWSRSQNPRAKAMVGPRFEQTVMEDQVRQLDPRAFQDSRFRNLENTPFPSNKIMCS